MSLLKLLVLFCVIIYGGATLNLDPVGTHNNTALLAESTASSIIPSQSNTSLVTPSIIPSLIDLSTPTTPVPTTPSFPTPSTTPTSTTPTSTTSTSTTSTSTVSTPTTPTPTTPTPTTPTSTTSLPTTPTPTTPSPPHPVPASWTVVDEKNNVTCIVVKLAASFHIPYENLLGEIENATVVLPGNATSNGTCNMDSIDNSNSQEISLQWMVDKDFPNMLTLVFHKNVSSVGAERSISKEQFYLSDIILQIYPDSTNFPNSLNASYINGAHLSGNLFPVEVNNSYRCNSEETVELEFDKNVGFVRLTNVQLEAFRSQTSDKFNSAVDCSADKIFTSDIVPIAVGCALAALVVIVLVAYLIGRRRARQRGYQSV